MLGKKHIRKHDTEQLVYKREIWISKYIENNLMHSFFSTCQEYIHSDDILILAISGGIDSMVLFDLIRGQHPKSSIIVAHFDHSLRGSESDGDRDLIANICKRENIQFEVQKMDIASLAKSEKMNIEAIARRERYTFLAQVRNKYNAKYILTAHHAGDQTETIIGNIIKGAKVRGISGMNIISSVPFFSENMEMRDNSLLRPLLSTNKSAIIDYATKNNIEYREDSTNLDMSYDRNRIRHDIIPVLESLNPSIHSTMSELAEYMQELNIFLISQVENWLIDSEIGSGKTDTFLIKSFVTVSPFFQSEIISYLYARAQYGSTQGLSRGLIDELIRFILDPGSFGKKEIKKLKLERRGERIFIL